VPEGDISTADKIGALFDHLVGGANERQRYRDAERGSRFEVNHEFHFRGLLDRQVGWLGAFEDAAGVEAPTRRYASTRLEAAASPRVRDLKSQVT
jgi:hypothetical protein